MTAPPSRVSRTSSSYYSARTSDAASSTTTTLNNGWNVPDPAVTVGSVGGHSRPAEQAPSGDHAHAEHELSSLYVSAERAAMNDIDKHLARGKQRQGWASSLLNSAVSATVFGAAVGLTAYRLWSGWRSDVEADEHDDDDEVHQEDEHHDAGTSKGGDRLVQSDISEPPPAYDTLLDEASTVTSSSPAGSVSTPRRRRKRRIKRPSIAELIVATQLQEARLRSPPTRSTSSRTSSPDSSSPAPALLFPVPGQTPQKSKQRAPEPIEEENESDSEAMSARLDDMARRIQGLIDDGQRALESRPSPPSADPIPLLSVTHNAEVSGGDPASPNGCTARRASDSGLVPDPATPSKRPVLDAPRHSMPNISPSTTQQAQHTRIPSYHGSALGRGPRPIKSGPAPTLYGGGTAPPLPWRRERVGSNKWIQRPPSPTLGQLAHDAEPSSVGSSAGAGFDYSSLSSASNVSDPSHPGTPLHGTWSGSSSRPLTSPEPPTHLRPASPTHPMQTPPARSRIPRFDHGRNGSISSRPASAAGSVARPSSAARAETPKLRRQRSGTVDGTPTRRPHSLSAGAADGTPARLDTPTRQPRSLIPLGMQSIKPGTVAQRRLSFSQSPPPASERNLNDS